MPAPVYVKRNRGAPPLLFEKAPRKLTALHTAQFFGHQTDLEDQVIDRHLAIEGTLDRRIKRVGKLIPTHRKLPAMRVVRPSDKRLYIRRVEESPLGTRPPRFEIGICRCRA